MIVTILTSIYAVLRFISSLLVFGLAFSLEQQGIIDIWNFNAILICAFTTMRYK